jgi:flagellar basal body-associated protein FliL
MKNLKDIFNFGKRKNKEKETNEKTLGFESQTFEKDGTTLNDQISAKHQAILDKIEPRAKADAQASPSLPHSSLTTPSGYEPEIRYRYQTMVGMVRSSCEDTLSDLAKRCASLAAECAGFIKNKEKFIEKTSEKSTKKKDNEESKDSRIYEDKKGFFARKIERIKAIIENVQNSIHEFEQILADDYEANFKDKHRTLVILLVIIGILESPMNYLLLSLWREGIIGTILLTMLFSILVPISAHAFGGLLKKKKNSKKDILWMSLAVAVAITISAIVGYVRSNYLSEKGVDILSSWGYGALNFILFIVASWLSYHFGFKNPEIIKAVKQSVERLEVENKNLAKVQEELYELEEQTTNKQHQVADQFDDTAQLDFERKHSSMLSEMKSKEKEYSGALTAVKSLEETINNYFFEAVHQYRSINEKWRNDSLRPVFWDNEIEPLKTYYNHISDSGDSTDMNLFDAV